LRERLSIVPLPRRRPDGAAVARRASKRLRVWYWNGEDPKEETERRIAAILLHFKIPPEEIEGWLLCSRLPQPPPEPPPAQPARPTRGKETMAVLEEQRDAAQAEIVDEARALAETFAETGVRAMVGGAAQRGREVKDELASFQITLDILIRKNTDAQSAIVDAEAAIEAAVKMFFTPRNH
jgi:hypothetical protein